MVLPKHGHACLVHGTRQDQVRALARYVHAALGRGDRFLYIVDQDADTGAVEALASHGVDVEGTLADGSLVVLSVHDTYLQGGHFDPDRTIALLRAATEDALASGFAGMSGAAEMTWALEGAPGTDRLLEYERRLDDVFRSIPASALCQYDTRRFAPDAVEEAMRAHPLVVTRDRTLPNPEQSEAAAGGASFSYKDPMRRA